MGDALLIADVDRIQSYIFATNRLLEIRGASALLSCINETEIPAAVGKFTGARLILSAAGMAKIVLPESDAPALESELHRIYRGKTRSATITTHIQPITAGFADAVTKGEQALRQKKAAGRHVRAVVHNPFFKRCEVCGVEPASKQGAGGRASAAVCQSCFLKQQQANLPMKAAQRVARELKQIVGDAVQFEFPDTADDEALERKAEERYRALIVADGNRMGQCLPHITSESEFKDFSAAVDKATVTAVAKAVESIYSARLAGAGGPQKIPLRILILGGDDVVLWCEAEVALALANEMIKQFHRITGTDNNVNQVAGRAAGSGAGSSIGMAAGIAIAKQAFPVYVQHAAAHSLCSHAKALCRKGLWDACALDAAILTSAAAGDFGAWRDSAYRPAGTAGFLLTGGPYPVDGEGSYTVGSLLDDIAALSDADAGVPRSRLKALRAMLQESSPARADELLKLHLARISPRGQTTLRGVLNGYTGGAGGALWRGQDQSVSGSDSQTNLADIVEMAEFARRTAR